MRRRAFLALGLASTAGFAGAAGLTGCASKGGGEGQSEDDWADAYLGRSKKLTFKTDYEVTTSPGSSGIYDFLSDSFALPKGAPHRAAAEKWLIECGSVDGQDAFNPQKGSVPARTDIDKSKYTGYLAKALTDWQSASTTVVGSLTHGVVANTAWNAAIDTALAAFVRDRNATRFADAVAAGRTL